MRPFPGAPLLPHDALQCVDADGCLTVPKLSERCGGQCYFGKWRQSLVRLSSWPLSLIVAATFDAPSLIVPEADCACTVALPATNSPLLLVLGRLHVSVLVRAWMTAAAELLPARNPEARVRE